MNVSIEARWVAAFYRFAFDGDERALDRAMHSAFADLLGCDISVSVCFWFRQGCFADVVRSGLAAPEEVLLTALHEGFEKFSEQSLVDSSANTFLDGPQTRPLVVEFLRRSQVATADSGHTTLLLSSECGGRQKLVLLHRATGADFSARQKAALCSLVFYAQQAESLRLATRLNARASAMRGVALGFVNRKGFVLGTSGNFIALIQRYFPSWSGGAVPFDTALPSPFSPRAGLSARVTRDGDLWIVDLWESTLRDELSPREKQCAEGVSRGLSIKEISRELELSESSVSTLLQRAMKKLGVTQRRELKTIMSAQVG